MRRLASDLGLHGLPISHQYDAMLIWSIVNIKSPTVLDLNTLCFPVNKMMRKLGETLCVDVSV